MGYLLAFIFFVTLQGRTDEMTANQVNYLFLTNLNGFYSLVLPFALVFFLVGLGIFITQRKRGGLFGCAMAAVGVGLGLGPLFHWLLIQGMLASFSPELGVIDSFKFFGCLILYVLTGMSP